MTQSSSPASRLQPTGPLQRRGAGRAPEPGSAGGIHRWTVAIHTHGCKLNQADSDLLARCFVDAGYRIVDRTAGADVFVLNTCTVTAAADAKARQALRTARRANPKALIVATGCYSQRAGDELGRLEPPPLVVGNARKDRLVSTVTAALAGREGVRHDPLASPATGLSTALRTGLDGSGGEQPRVSAPWSATGRSRAMIKTQEGCNQVCAYCIVPKVRGRERSIPPDAVLEQINCRAEQGCQEVVLTGTQLGTYGYDVPGASLLKLLQRILAQSTIPRVRVSSIQPQEITPELLGLWQDRRLCPHFHVPLQSGNDRILTAMRRRYDTASFARAVELVRRAVPDAGITTDLIVGFPGESDGEFQESLRFAESMQFSDMHIFPYSPRPGTGAAYFGAQVLERVKRARSAAMLQVAHQGFRAFRHRQLGQTRPVLWESLRKTGAVPLWSGLTDNYIRVSTEDRWDLRNAVTVARLVDLAGDCVTTRTP